MVVDYQQGKIYRLVGSGKTYIGSTCQPLHKRKFQHKQKYDDWKDGKKHYFTSFECFENEDPDIILVETFACDNKDELHKRERYWIESMECVNKTIPSRSIKEYYQDNKDEIKARVKQYAIENKEKVKEYKKKYASKLVEAKPLTPIYSDDKDEPKQLVTNAKQRKQDYYYSHQDEILQKKKEYDLAHKDVIKEKGKIYRESKKDEIAEKKRLYREKNKEKLAEKKKQKVVCECGASVCSDKLSRHKKTLSHIDFINKKTT